jgi:hypothetical protein
VVRPLPKEGDVSVLGDLRSVSEDAVTRLAVRFSDLPRPVLAAIGAGDLVAEQVQDLREIAAMVLDRPATHHASGRGPRPAGGQAADAGVDLADLVDRARRLAALFSTVAGRLPSRSPRNRCTRPSSPTAVSPGPPTARWPSAGGGAGRGFEPAVVPGRWSTPT